MKTTFNKNFPKKIMPFVSSAMEKALSFIKEKYPTVSLEQASINFSNTRNGSYYYHKSASINIAVRSKLFLYDKATCELTTPTGGILVGTEIATTTIIIHELTHYIQGIEKRKFSEVETTQNEIDYLKLNEPFWYGKLVPNKKQLV